MSHSSNSSSAVMNVVALLVSLFYLFYSAPKGIDSQLLKTFYIVLPAGLTSLVVQEAFVKFQGAAALAGNA